MFAGAMRFRHVSAGHRVGSLTRGVTVSLAFALLLGYFISPLNLVHADSSSSISDPLSFSDNFDNGLTNGWTAVDEGRFAGPSNWAVQKGYLWQTSNIWGGKLAASDITKPGTDFVTGNTNWANYDYSVNMRSTDNDDMGVVFRYQDSNNYYRFSMDAQNKYMRLVKKVNGAYQLLAQKATGYTPGTTYTVRVLAVGTKLQVFVNSASVFSVTDSSLRSGEIGLYTWGDTGTSFDNVSAQVQDDDFFSIAVLPDIQNETQYNPALLNSETAWIANARGPFNLAMVLQEGDIVNDRGSQAQWATAKEYLSRFDGKVPFVLAAGNHDLEQYGPGLAAPYPTDPTNYNNLIASFSSYPISGQYRSNDYRDTYTLFSAGGVDMMIMNLEFGAPSDVLTWAGHIADEYPARHIIMLTHDYLGDKGEIRGSPGDTALPAAYSPDLNNPNVIWGNFVNKHKNVQLTLNGHVVDPTSSTMPWSTGEFTTNTAAGGTVFQMLANYQNYKNGDGYFRMLKFYPLQNKVIVTTYSPYLNAHLTDGLDQFTLNGVDLSAWSATNTATSADNAKANQPVQNAQTKLLTPQQAAQE